MERHRRPIFRQGREHQVVACPPPMCHGIYASAPVQINMKVTTHIWSKRTLWTRSKSHPILQLKEVSHRGCKWLSRKLTASGSSLPAWTWFCPKLQSLLSPTTVSHLICSSGMHNFIWNLGNFQSLRHMATYANTQNIFQSLKYILSKIICYFLLQIMLLHSNSSNCLKLMLSKWAKQDF